MTKFIINIWIHEHKVELFYPIFTANVGTSFLLVFFVTELPIDIFPEKSCHTHRKREEVDHCCTAAVVQCQLFSVQMPAIIRENVYWKLCFPVLDQSHLQCTFLEGTVHLNWVCLNFNQNMAVCIIFFPILNTKYNCTSSFILDKAVIYPKYWM